VHDDGHGRIVDPLAASGTIDDEGSLLARIAGGDRAAFEALLSLHQDRVLRATRRIVRDDSEAEDITQEAFLRLWRTAASFKPSGGGVGGWLRQVARNLAIDRVRRQGRLTEYTAEHEPVMAAAQHQGLEQRETAALVEHALGALPERQRLALVLFHYEGLSMAAIANELSTTADAVESLLSRARRTLRVDLGGVWRTMTE
jgi:RNA polymerase sigma-70 factor, ECF subfamily